MDVECLALTAVRDEMTGHQIQIDESKDCGCYFCMAVFSASEIEHWADKGQTALCPFCGIDSVIGDKSGFPVSDPRFLNAMNKISFSPSEPTG